VERIDNILVQMLAASRGSDSQRIPLDIVACLERVLEQYAVQVQAQGVSVSRQIEHPLPDFEADVTEIEQIFSNLIGNALFEMPTGGRLIVRLFAEDGMLKVQIADSGAGIPEENIVRIFDPFFTTKEKGTGFGLSVVLRIVKGYGGHIHVESILGNGATFHISLPLFGNFSQ
jgi:signal transduction histidine kinase